MAKIQRANQGRLFFHSAKNRTRALVLGTLGLIPAACQSPVARFIPAQTIRELRDSPPPPPLNAEKVAREISDRTGDESIVWNGIKSWGQGVGISSLGTACLPLIVSYDISGFWNRSGHEVGHTSFMSAGSANIAEYKIPSYTSSLLGNAEGTYRPSPKGQTCENCGVEKE